VPIFFFNCDVLYSNQSLWPDRRHRFFPQQSYHPPIPGKHFAVIVRNNVLVDLNTLISSSGFIITDAVGINDSGQILCTATNTSGNAHAVLIAPR